MENGLILHMCQFSYCIPQKIINPFHVFFGDLTNNLLQYWHVLIRIKIFSNFILRCTYNNSICMKL